MLPRSAIRRRRKKKQSSHQPTVPDPEPKPLETEHVASTTDIQHPNPTRRSKAKLSQDFVQQELEIQEALNMRMKAKKMLPETEEAVSKSPTISQKLQRDINFFTDCITEVDCTNLPREAISEAANIEDTTQNIEKSNDGQQKLASSFIQIEDDPILKFWRPKKVEPADQDLFFTDKNAELNEHTLSLVEARNMEDDGIFVHPRPTGVSEEMENFLIARLLRAGRPECVQLNRGKPQLIGVRSAAVRGQLMKSVSMKEFVPIFYEPRPFNLANKIIMKAEKSNELRVFLESIVFDYSNEPDAERRLTQQITDLYAQYRTMNQSNTVGHLEQKLVAIRQVISKATADQDVAQLVNDRRDLRNKLHREQQANRDLLRTILEHWVQLKEVRQKQGFTGTTLKLLIRTNETKEDEDQKQWDLEFDFELSEVLEESVQFYNKSKRERQEDVASKDLPIPNPDEIEKMLHDIFVRSKRHPGEPIVWLELEHVTLADKAAASVKTPESKFAVKLSAGKHKSQAIRTASCLGSKVLLNVELVINVHDGSSNEQCQICIIEEKPTTLLNKEPIQIFVPLPRRHEIYQQSEMLSVNFSTTSKRSGKVILRMGWTADSCRDKCETSFTKPKPSKMLLEPTTVNTIQAWYDQGQIDPMDPEATSLVEAIQSANPQIEPTEPSKPNNKLFRLNEDLTAFCSEKSILEDKRLNMLTARFNSHLQMKDAKCIPPIDREIAEDQEGTAPIIEELHWMDPIDLHRHNGKKRLLHIYRTISNHCEVLSKHSDSQDLLIGDAVPTFSSFVATIRQLFSSNRPLNPQRCRPVMGQSMRSVAFKPQEANNVRIIVNVIRAQGIPCRNVISEEPRTATPMHIARTSTVMPYVVAGFREKSSRTCTAEGSNPTWNEQLVIPINGFPNLVTIKDTLHIQLFDEHVEDLLDEDRSRANEIYQRISSRWLGDIRIPLFTILSSQRVEGTFEINTPILLLGYSKSSKESLELSLNDGKHPEPRSSAHLTLFIHVEPATDSDELHTSHLACSELPEIVNRVSVWLNEFCEEFPNRFWDPLVTLTDGKRVCITRLVGAIAIPFDRNNVAEFLIRRFVALVPILRNGGQCTKLNGVWLTNEQSLEMLSVSAKDLGTMLVCFYLTLGFRAYLVVGFALPHGDTAFVLTKENGEFFLIDPTSGRKYMANDTMCPLVRVYAIVSGDNVWANIQRETRVCMMHFNVAHSSEWRPLFGRSCAAPTGIVHNSTCAYPASEEVFDLKKIIEWKVMKKISAWRPHRKTTWNRHISETLSQILIDLEDDICFGYEPGAISAYVDRLNEVAGLFHVSGFPLNMRYVSLSDVVQRLKTTGIHMNPDSRVEFSVAVHIQPYPCNVLSLWLFVVSMVPKN